QRSILDTAAPPVDGARPRSLLRPPAPGRHDHAAIRERAECRNHGRHVPRRRQVDAEHARVPLEQRAASRPPHCSPERWTCAREVRVHALTIAFGRAIPSALYRRARKTRFPCVSDDPAKNGLPKKGFVYSQTISPSLVTSKKRPKDDSQMSVLPFGKRCALPMRGEKKFHAGRS